MNVFFQPILCCVHLKEPSQLVSLFVIWTYGLLTYLLNLKAPITTAADDKFCNIFPSFWQK